MALSRTPLIAREGWPVFGLLLLAAIFVQLAYGFVALPLWGLLGLVAFLYRDPPRSIPAAPLGVVSPGNGRVLAVEPRHDPYLGREALSIRLTIGRLDPYSIRSPIEGKLQQQWLHPPEGGAGDGRLTRSLHVQTDEGDDVVVVMCATGLLRRMSCTVHTGERIGQGQRCGFVLFGSRIEVLVPAASRALVQPGERVQAGTSVLATLVHK